MTITLTGDNTYLINARLGELIAEFSGNNDNYSVEKIGFNIELDQLISNLQSVSLLSPSRIFIINKPELIEGWTDKFEDIKDTFPESTIIILIEPNVDKRSKYYKLLQKFTQFESFNFLSDPELIDWLVKYALLKSGKLSYQDAKYIVENVGNDQFKLHNEMDKLLSFDKNINQKSIDLLIEPSVNTNVFKLLDAAFVGDYEKITKIFKQLRKNKVEIPAIIGAIAWQLHVFALIKTNVSLDSNNLSKVTKVHPFVIDKSSKLIAKHSLRELADYSQRFVDLCLSFANYEVDEEEAIINFLSSFSKQTATF